jgi:hypothetical protein
VLKNPERLIMAIIFDAKQLMLRPFEAARVVNENLKRIDEWTKSKF